MIKSLKARNHELSSVNQQLEWLAGPPFSTGDLPSFKQKLSDIGIPQLIPSTLDILQMNIGYMCNQTCRHCHVDAGPDRKEMMTRETMRQCLDFAVNNNIQTLDITGGAPEMNPDFYWLIEQASEAGISEIIVRSNLTILRSNKKYFDTPLFFKKHGLRIVSSLPFYKADKTDKQRGKGVFNHSIEALKALNEVGYGKEDHLKLDLVFNPSGAFLPAEQISLEKEFKKELKETYDISFHQLLSITNLPVSRFLEFLIDSENFDEYMDTLVESFNPSTLLGLMCKNTLSVRWDGMLYDCDFNQMLDMKIQGKNQQISTISIQELTSRHIKTHQHCYGCTAGAGSSCQGVII